MLDTRGHIYIVYTLEGDRKREKAGVSEKEGERPQQINKSFTLRGNFSATWPLTYIYACTHMSIIYIHSVLYSYAVYIYYIHVYYTTRFYIYICMCMHVCARVCVCVCECVRGCCDACSVFAGIKKNKYIQQKSVSCRMYYIILYIRIHYMVRPSVVCRFYNTISLKSRGFSIFLPT